MLQVLLVGTLVTDRMSDDLRSIGIAPPPADNAQRYMLIGLSEQQCVACVSAVCSPRLPRRQPDCVESLESVEDWGYLRVCGFDNSNVFSFLNRETSLVRAAKKWGQEHVNDQVLVICYSMHSPFLRAALAVKRLVPSAKICVVVPDLPKYMSNRSPLSLYGLLKKIDEVRINSLRKQVDFYALYTSAMADYFGLERSQWLLFEGLYEDVRDFLTPVEKHGIKTLLYAGSLDMRYGIVELIKAVEQTQSDCQLLIYGKDEFGDIEQICKYTKKAVYMGVVSADEVFQEMRKAHFLINPRPANLALTQYSFPSKTFEYMASGTPVIMNKLAGIPDEYDAYLTYFPSEKISSMTRALDEVLQSDYQTFFEKGKRARAFVLDNKCGKRQMKRLVEFSTSL